MSSEDGPTRASSASSLISGSASSSVYTSSSSSSCSSAWISSTGGGGDGGGWESILHTAEPGLLGPGPGERDPEPGPEPGPPDSVRHRSMTQPVCGRLQHARAEEETAGVMESNRTEDQNPLGSRSH
ncbi:hypothetical protein EYF80_058992 [Liparis tanakae]|uniref:Uncharacterized protein n=1 Tax=Liparis tanakae TaxID=230148 RepID=A0A4Z2EPI0_9TELE|nr:hypothetical protein EYF80_058992 [Liparis tanakae]